MKVRRTYAKRLRPTGATLHFKLPADKSELHAALHGGEALSALWDIQEKLRTRRKYSSYEKDGAAEIDAVCSLVHEEIGGLLDNWN